MRLVTANIRNNPVMPLAKVRADMETVRSLATVVLWQEVGRASYQRTLMDTLGTGWQHAGLTNAVPISWRSKHWKAVGGGVHRTHKGRALASPARYLTWVLLAHQRTGEQVAVVNTHYVSGAWNKRLKLFKGWRKHAWTRHYEAHRDLVARLAASYTVVGGGDFNRRDVRALHPRLLWVAGEHRIDKLWLVPGPKGSTRLVPEPPSTVPLHSDHSALVARLRRA